MASLSTTIEYDGITWTITATEIDGGLSFDITPSTDTAGDIRGFFFDLETIDTGSSLQNDTESSDGFSWSGGTITGDAITETQWGENLVNDLGNGANMNGEEPSNSPIEGYEGPDIFDLGIEFGTPGAKGDFINSTSFTVTGMTLADLEDQYFGLRLTSTAPDGEGSLKLVGQFPSLDGDDPLYQGFTRGSWLHGSRSDDLTGLFEGSAPTYETLFLSGNTALTFTSAGKGNPTLDNPTLEQVLGLNGGGLNQFTAQSTAAYLNALYLEGDNDPLTSYSLSSKQVMEMTKAVLNGGSLGGTVDLSGYSWYQDTNGVQGFQQAGV
ncbi:hypothetical protein [Synechococcus sp. CBW1108]|uniref:hypothetical protein n=1 Tax=Synechococcus sp. CBW1108 TaxID=1353147 RepID=UPI0018CDACF9|nr:hypothetical protein [Synechococcus sp. CBW1108]QPN69123.1 hypothetical protein H8F27_10825 [Synechococcus sp. CBW1108]